MLAAIDEIYHTWLDTALAVSHDLSLRGVLSAGDKAGLRMLRTRFDFEAPRIDLLRGSRNESPK
jgi:hypothetical protein